MMTSIIPSVQHDQDEQYEFSKGIELCSFSMPLPRRSFPIVLQNLVGA
jgi:hypothetical protein